MKKRKSYNIYFRSTDFFSKPENIHGINNGIEIRNNYVYLYI